MRPKHLVTILILSVLAATASPAHAGGVVSICDETHLLTALAGGGTVTFSCSGTITLTAGITIAVDTTIDGSGQTVTISGNNAVRVFTVNSGVTFNLNELTVANGSAGSFGGPVDGGGGIRNEGTLNVSSSIFSGNSAGDGGGIYNAGGTVTVSNSTFSGNSTRWYLGGGIYNHWGVMTVSNSTFSDNNAYYGGGITNGDGGWLTVTNSTFSSNSGGSWGGAIRNDNMLTVSDSAFSGNSAADGGGIANIGGTLIVNNSTFSGNGAISAGGAIVNYPSGSNPPGTLTVSNSTFSGNGAAFCGGIAGGGIVGTVIVSNSTFSGNSATSAGGGICNATLKNTIVANSPVGGNCSGAITDGGGNLSYPDTTCPGINGDPLLGPLQNNGGPTETMALGPGSAALDAADDAICALPPVNNLDQRGIARPQGLHCDIGAVEQIQEPTAVSLSALSAQSLPGMMPSPIIVGLLLAALVGAVVLRRYMTQRKSTSEVF